MANDSTQDTGSGPAGSDPAGARRIAITGASGLIGSHLSDYFQARGHTVHPVTRSHPDDDKTVHWQPRGDQIETNKLEGVDVVIHLAGENLFGRWTKSKKEAILQSRIQGTNLIARTLAALDDPPEVFVSASAVGYYGDTGATVVDEASPPGDTFLAEVCKKWEEACQPAIDAGIRTVNPRLGVVLSPKGGALEVMLTPFKLGLGAKIGNGEQFMSLIVMDDVVGAIAHLVDHPDLDGAVNVTSPNPVTNQEFTKTLGGVLGRPTIFGIPSALVKLGAGKMGEEMLLNGQRAVPARLNESGFEFAFPELKTALVSQLNDAHS
jgi:uncharacterized protein (TIGR01777 family)